MNKCDGIKILELDPKRILEGNEYMVIAEKDQNFKAPINQIVDLVINDDRLKNYIDTTIESSIGDFKNEVNQSISELTSKINNLDSKITTVNNRITNLESSIDDIEQSITSINNKITNIENNLGNVGELLDEEYITQLIGIAGERAVPLQKRTVGNTNISDVFDGVNHIWPTRDDVAYFYDFNSIQLRFIWTDSNGRDFDTGTNITNAPSVPSEIVGWSWGSSENRTQPFLYWGGDNTQSGAECVMVDIKSIQDVYTNQRKLVWYKKRWYCNC